MSRAYYNENDPNAAAWLRELIKANLIAPGDVDERSIEDVIPTELAGYTQCHFFAGIGAWSYALRCAGWEDSRKAWTGSCPCQPFSQVGKGDAFADERHLWPAWFHLISQCQPDVVFGEQVESKDGRAWLDLVQSDLEAVAYAVGAVGLCAAGFGAPHIRQRLFFVADAACGSINGSGNGRARRRAESSIRGESGVLADATGQRYDGRRSGETSRWQGEPERSRDAGELGNTSLNGSRSLNGQSGESGRQEEQAGRSSFFGELGNPDKPRPQGRQLLGANREWSGIDQRTIGQAGATNGFWADAEWLYCRDGKFRPTKPGIFPLANGVAARVVKLRGIGNAINAQVAEAFIRAYMERE